MGQNNHGLLLVLFLLAVAGNWMIKPKPAEVMEAPKPKSESNDLMPEDNTIPPQNEPGGETQRPALGDDPLGIRERHSRTQTASDRLDEIQRIIESLNTGESTASPNPVQTPFAQMIQPVDFEMTSDYGTRKDPLRIDALQDHTGQDFAAPPNTELPAPSDGIIEYAGARPGHGLTVQIKHSEKISTLFAHLEQISVSTGQRIRKGQIIGKTGSTGRSTGPHLHYELRVDGKPVNPKVLVMMLALLSGQQDTGDF